jgi:hypothetical protein
VTGGPGDDESVPDAAGAVSQTSLTGFQIEVTRAFFALPAAQGFLLAGGAALAAQRLTMRPTRDLDLFTAPGGGGVPAAREAFENAACTRGRTVQVVRAGETFMRLIVQGPNEVVVVDLAVDSTPERPATVTLAGPSLDPEELAGRKMIALFDRAEARDFADVYVLAARYGAGRLLQLAATVDRGFDIAVFATMLDFLDRFSDDEIPASAADIRSLRTFFADWSRRLHEGDLHEGEE